jgi:hypothetical protein
MTNGVLTHEPVYPQDANGDHEKHYYAPPPAAYAYYPGMHPNGVPMHDGAMVYYPPPPPQPHQNGDNSAQGGPQNLPPADVARFIPCRYFPACRYGSSCIFLHPQGPYFQGGLPPPAQYPYDPMAPQPYAPNYYAVPPPSFQPPNGIHHMTPMSPQHQTSPHAPINHIRSGSEIVPAQGPFGPSAIPPSNPYGAMSPVSPAYAHPGQGPIPPNAIPIQTLHQPPLMGPLSPQAVYSATSPPPPPSFPIRHDMNGQYPQQPNGAYPDANGGPKSPLTTQPDGFTPNHGHREGMNHYRRGSVRRGSFGGGRKPPCLFFPAGRCKNGDDCRFPHIIPEGPVAHQPHYPTRGGFRSRPHINGNGVGRIESKLAGMSIRDDPSPQVNGSSRSQSSDGGRPRFPQGTKPNGANGVNGSRVDKKPAAKQRVPNADEFPVLAGSTTPPARSPGLNGSLTNGNGQPGPTAAQVLQAPPPTRRDSKDSSTRGATPDPRPNKEHAATEPNGVIAESPVLTKRQFSFGAVNGAPDMGKEVSVTA